MKEHMDLDVSGVLRYEYDLTKAGDMMMEVIDAQLTVVSAPLR